MEEKKGETLRESWRKTHLRSNVLSPTERKGTLRFLRLQPARCHLDAPLPLQNLRYLKRMTSPDTVLPYSQAIRPHSIRKPITSSLPSSSPFIETKRHLCPGPVFNFNMILHITHFRQCLLHARCHHHDHTQHTSAPLVAAYTELPKREDFYSPQ